MNYSFEYIDIILLAMIAGFIILRLRGILGKRTGFEGKTPPQFENILNIHGIFHIIFSESYLGNWLLRFWEQFLDSHGTKIYRNSKNVREN